MLHNLVPIAICNCYFSLNMQDWFWCNVQISLRFILILHLYHLWGSFLKFVVLEKSRCDWRESPSGVSKINNIGRQASEICHTVCKLSSRNSYRADLVWSKRMVLWQPPPIGTCKIKLDGAFFHKTCVASTEGLIRDQLEIWQAGFLMNIGMCRQNFGEYFKASV